MLDIKEQIRREKLYHKRRAGFVMLNSWNNKQLAFGIVTVVLMIFGLNTGETLFFALCGGTYSILVFSRWWHNNALKGVSISFQLDKKRIFPGETTILRVEVSNRKRFSIPFIRFCFKTHSSVSIKGMKRVELNRKRVVWSNLCGVKGKQTVVYEYELTVNERGLIRLDDVDLESGDPFGIGKVTRRENASLELVVYPSFVDLIPIRTNFQNETGDHTVRRFLFDDPTYHVGARPYAPGDSMKRIDWNVSARTRTLYTKQFAFTSQKHVAIIGNVHTAEVHWMSQENEVIERTISMLATLMKWCTEQGYTYEWMLNIKLPKVRKYVHENGGVNKTDFIYNLEKLGRLKSFISVNILAVFAKMQEVSSAGKIILVITSYRTEKMEQEWRKLIKKGGQVWVIDPKHEEIKIERYHVRGRKGEKSRVS